MAATTPRRWLVLEVPLSPRDDPGLVIDALLGLGVGAIEERDGVLVTHLPAPPDVSEVLASVRKALRTGAGIEEAELSWSWQPHEEWAETWKRGLKPRRVGRGFLVAPTWCDVRPRTGDRVIRMDPGVAFGTAEHATTRGCLALLEGVVETGERVLDAGAGTGILAIAAALVGAAEVVAVESDALACDAARENVATNGVADRVHVVHAELDAEDLGERGPLDGVVANIQSGILLSLLPGARHALRPDGWLILGGVLVDERDQVVSAATDHFFELLHEEIEDEWWSGALRRRR